VIAELGAHLVAARHKIVERTRDLLSGASRLNPEQYLFDFADDD